MPDTSSRPPSRRRSLGGRVTRVLLPIVVEIGRDIGHEPFQLWRRAYACLIELLRQNLGIGSQLRLVETQEYVARAYMHSIANRNISHDTAGGMLDFLEVRFHHQCARHDDRARQRHETRPAPDNAHADGQHAKADLQLAFKSTRQPFGE
jgi:hypothetical protein